MTFGEAMQILAAFERHQVRYPDLESEVLRVEGLSVRVATPRMLYRMKRGTVRPQDRLDAQVLKERFGLEDD